MSELQTKIDKTISVLDDNTKIEDNIKARILLLAIDFYKRFPEVPLENFYERLQNAEILGGSKYLYNTAIQYLPKTNEIIINREMLAKDETDVDHSMMKVIIAMITSKDNYYGFAENKNLEALNIGFTDMVARTLVGNEGISDYQQELEIVDFIGKRIGVKPFTEAFFTNNPDLLLKPMLELCNDPQGLNDLLDKINHNMYTRNKSAENSEMIPLQLEKQMMEMFGEMDISLARQTINTVALPNVEKSK